MGQARNIKNFKCTVLGGIHHRYKRLTNSGSYILNNKAAPLSSFEVTLLTHMHPQRQTTQTYNNCIATMPLLYTVQHMTPCIHHTLTQHTQAMYTVSQNAYHRLKSNTFLCSISAGVTARQESDRGPTSEWVARGIRTTVSGLFGAACVTTSTIDSPVFHMYKCALSLSNTVSRLNTERVYSIEGVYYCKHVWD